MVPQTLLELLRYPLLTLSGGVVTPGSVLVGVLVVATSLLVSALTARWIIRVLALRGLSHGAQFAVAKIARYCILTVGAAIAFNSMGLKLDALIAASTVLAVGIGFGLQNVAQNFISGLILLVEQPVRKGDYVKVGDTVGVIDDIGLRATHIITRDEVTMIVPNSALISAPVINHSRPTNKLRVRIALGVDYGADMAKVRAALLAAAGATRGVLDDPAAEVRLEAFGASSIDLALLVWISDPKDDLRIGSELRFAIDAAFRAADIAMPFPRRDVHVLGLERLLARPPRGDAPRLRPIE